ncbi:MAG: DNA-packaging protein [Clostridia bacterium]|nr:DNA-packaging protein [Clostridia bacterium]
MTLLERVKIANRITTSAYDDELEELIKEAKADLGLKGIDLFGKEEDANIRRAIVVYCCIHHGQREDREMLQRSYDDLKSRLSMSTGYTKWGSAG